MLCPRSFRPGNHCEDVHSFCQIFNKLYLALYPVQKVWKGKGVRWGEELECRRKAAVFISLIHININSTVRAINLVVMLLFPF